MSVCDCPWTWHRVITFAPAWCKAAIKKNTCVRLPTSTCLSEVTMTTAEFLLSPRLSWLGRASNFALFSHFPDLHRRLSSTHRVLLILTFPASLYHLPSPWAPSDSSKQQVINQASTFLGSQHPSAASGGCDTCSCLPSPEARARRPCPAFMLRAFSIFILSWKHLFSLLRSTFMLGRRFQFTFCDKIDHMEDANLDL